MFKSKEGRKELINSIIAILIAILFLFPIYWLVQISFKSDSRDIWQDPYLFSS